MTAKAYLLSDDDRKLLQEFLDEQRRQQRRTINRPHVDNNEEFNQAPETYIALTPFYGIPPLFADKNVGTGTGSGTGLRVSDKNTPGYSDCQIYKIIYTHGIPDLRPMGFSKRVYNLSPFAIPGSRWIGTTRDKSGSWIAIPTWCCFPTSTIGTGTQIICGCWPVNSIPTYPVCLTLAHFPLSGDTDCQCLWGSFTLPYQGSGIWRNTFTLPCARGPVTSDPIPCDVIMEFDCASGSSFTMGVWTPHDSGQCFYSNCAQLLNSGYGGYGLGGIGGYYGSTADCTIVSCNPLDVRFSLRTLSGPSGFPGTLSAVIRQGGCGGGTGTGTGTGGGGMITTTCCPSGIPPGLHLTIQDMGGCGCLAGSYQITYNALSNSWLGNASGICGSESINIEFACDQLVTPNNWVVAIGGCSSGVLGSVFANSVNCSSPTIVFDNGGMGYVVSNSCCTGTIKMVVTL